MRAHRSSEEKKKRKKTDGEDTGGPHIVVKIRPCFTNQNFYLQGKDEIQNQQ